MTEAVDWRDVLSSSVSLEFKALKLRVSDRFFVGGLHQNVKAYDDVLENHSLAEPIGRWIRNGAHIVEFARPFSGVYEQVKYFHICRHQNSFQTMRRAEGPQKIIQ